MNVDKRMIEPFNEWRRASGNHCDPDVKTVEAFQAGFKAGLKRGVDESMAILNGTPLTHQTRPNHGES